MLDVWSTLQPEAGLARQIFTSAPDGDLSPMWTIAVDIGREDGAGFALDLVGGAGVRRGDAFVRAAGEAVERYALIPRTTLPDAEGAPEIERGILWRGEHAEGWYAGRRLVDGTTVRVPAPVVDYPLAEGDGRYDPTPSGAAAGSTYDAAVTAALRELVEREVSVVAWARQAATPRIDLERSLVGD